MKKIYIIFRNIFLLSFVAFIYYIARPEIKPREILSSVRSLFETKEETDLREIREAMECTPDKPLSRGERYALAMKEYWRRQVNSHWGADEWLENNMENPPPKGLFSIVINKNMCGLERDWFGHPKFMRTDSCYPFRLDGYSTLEALLKKQPEFVSERGNSDFAYMVRKNLGGIKSDPNGEGFLQQPDYYNRPSGFGVLKTDDWFVKFYAEDCCALLSYKQFVPYFKQRSPIWADRIINDIPIEIRENADYLAIKYTFIKSNINKKLSDSLDSDGINYIVNPCGELVSF